MAKKKRPAKLESVLDAVRRAVEEGKYRDTIHASQRQGQRRITRPEYLYVLRNGYHEKAKDKFVDAYHAWNYAIRGRTVDRRDLRVIVSFDGEGMLIITVIEVDK